MTFNKESSRSEHNCHQGNIQLPPSDLYPEEFKRLLLELSEIGRHFRSKIRVSNLFTPLWDTKVLEQRSREMGRVAKSRGLWVGERSEQGAESP